MTRKSAVRVGVGSTGDEEHKQREGCGVGEKVVAALEVRPGLAVATVTGNLVVRDNKYTLTALEPEKEEGEPRVKRGRSSGEAGAGQGAGQEFPLSKQRPQHYLYGTLNSTEFVTRLTSRGITDAKVEKMI